LRLAVAIAVWSQVPLAWAQAEAPKRVVSYKIFWTYMDQVDARVNELAKAGFKLRSATLTQCPLRPLDPKSTLLSCFVVIMEREPE
jgi:hypothetical protein